MFDVAPFSPKGGGEDAGIEAKARTPDGYRRELAPPSWRSLSADASHPIHWRDREG
jgi:hypothetical protein